MSTALMEIDAPPELKNETADCVKWSNANQITTPERYQETGDHLKKIKAALRVADEFFDPLVKQAFDLHKLAVARKKSITDPLKQSETLDKAKMLQFTQAQERAAEEHRRKLQAEADEKARKEREKIEQAAAKQRAIEEEARAKAEAARRAEENARREAEQASAAKRKKLLEAAEAARLEAEAADRKANAAFVKQSFAEERAAEIVAPVIAVAPTVAPKAAGVSVRKAWKAEIVDQAAFLAFACESKRTDLILPNIDVLNALAKGLKEMASMPGVKFTEVSTMSARS